MKAMVAGWVTEGGRLCKGRRSVLHTGPYCSEQLTVGHVQWVMTPVCLTQGRQPHHGFIGLWNPAFAQWNFFVFLCYRS